MAGRHPARFLAPIALVAFCIALYLVVTSTTRDGGTDAATQGERTRPASDRGEASRQRTRRSRTARRYTIRPGDTLSSIAERFDTTTAEIEALNPNLDPQSLAPGRRIRVRR